MKHYWGVYDQNTIVCNVLVDDLTSDAAIIASNELNNDLYKLIR